MSLDFTPLAIPHLTGPAEDAERERARRRGHAMGYAEGMRAARDQAAQEAEKAAEERRAATRAAAAAAAQAVTALQRAAASLAARTELLAEVAEERVLQLAVELAEVIVEREFSDPVRAALTAVARATAAAGGDERATVTLSEADLATLTHLEAHPAGVQVAARADLLPGDAVVHLADGEVDLRVQSALERVRAVLAEAG
ncbi:flagellar assembly protein FliH [Microbacterium sp. zg.Y1084]|uniref:FliH/SctL family protein n=1 Tax=Microbacterium sp. zg.Y1084 TaxID=2969667 RepID=UPI00214B8A33|nr:flagellar assembly protein FliH [Microbacterium sp. zg.Y1084]MCR2813980.1 flagellar assembly protein FliH [Microbacterium sp. zg.Y1084]